MYSGVVSRLVKSDGHVAMLQTTAAVHPGGSGGAVVDVSGRLIGLVTSAARHSGGSMLPHLNFSIPVEALKPVFAFAKAGKFRTVASYPLVQSNQVPPILQGSEVNVDDRWPFCATPHCWK